jgi:hypothetical protein
MSTGVISPRYLSKVIANVTLPSVQDLNRTVAQAINTLFARHCRKVDPAGDCIVATVDPHFLASKFMSSVTANAYLPYETKPDQPNLPRLNFVARITAPYTELLAGRLKQNVALAIAGFLVASHDNPFPVVAVNIYKDHVTSHLLKTAHVYQSVPVDLPTVLPGELPVKAYLALLSEPVIIPPDDTVVLETVAHPSIPSSPEHQINALVMWLPPIIFTSRSAYIQAIAPRTSPTT